VYESVGNETSILFTAPDDAIDWTVVEKPAITNDKPPTTTDKPAITGDKSVETADRKPIGADRKPIGADRILGERALLVIDYIDEHGSIVNGEAQTLLGVKDTAVKRVFKYLLQLGLIEAVGEKRHRVYRRPLGIQ